MPLNDLSAFAMPPVPEAMGSFAELDRLSHLRGDDLVYGGSMFSFDLARMMETATEAVQAYSSLCSDSLTMNSTPAEGAAAAIGEELKETLGISIESESGIEPDPEPDTDGSLNVNEVLFSFMSESDKLGELSKLLGRLRFAVDGSDQAAADEVSSEIIVLSRYLPENFRVNDLLDVAKDNSDKSSQLAKLYIDRCFRLSAGENAEADELAIQIQLLRDQA